MSTGYKARRRVVFSTPGLSRTLVYNDGVSFIGAEKQAALISRHCCLQPIISTILSLLSASFYSRHGLKRTISIT
jgi:hypothetical protein